MANEDEKPGALPPADAGADADEPINLEIDLSMVSLPVQAPPPPGDRPPRSRHDEYKPNWNPPIGGVQQGPPSNHDYHQSIDDLVNEFLRQQAALNQAQANDTSFRAVLRRWRKVIIYGFGAVFLALLVKLQYDFANDREKNLADLQQQLGTMGKTSKEQITTAEILKNLPGLKLKNQLEKAEEYRARFVVQQTKAQKMVQRFKERFLDAKPQRLAVTTAVIAKPAVARDQKVWPSVVQCAATAVWTTHRSVNFMSLRQDFVTILHGPYLLVYSPYFAGHEQVILPGLSDLFEQKLRKLFKPAAAPPVRSQNIVLAALGLKNDQPEYYYFTMTDRSQFRVAPVVMAGKAHLSWVELRRQAALLSKGPGAFSFPVQNWPTAGRFQPVAMQRGLWAPVTPADIDPTAANLLVQEIERQIDRYKASPLAPINAPKDQHYARLKGATPQQEYQARMAQLATMQQCFTAGRALERPKITNAAIAETQFINKLLKQRPAAKGRVAH